MRQRVHTREPLPRMIPRSIVVSLRHCLTLLRSLSSVPSSHMTLFTMSALPAIFLFLLLTLTALTSTWHNNYLPRWHPKDPPTLDHSLMSKEKSLSMITKLQKPCRWQMSVILALGRWRQVDRKLKKSHPFLHSEFKARLDYMSLKTQKKVPSLWCSE